MHELAAAVKIVRTLISMSHSESQSQQMDDVRRSIAAVWKQLESHNEVEEQLVYNLPSKLLTSNEQQRSSRVFGASYRIYHRDLAMPEKGARADYV